MTTVAEVRLWGKTIGAVSQDSNNASAAFQYHPDFLSSHIELSPIAMPLAARTYTFPSLPKETFHGLPGLLADSLPDRFGNALIDAWLVTQGRTVATFNAVDRLCYIGARGMGALEFHPTLGPRNRKSTQLDFDALVALATDVLSHRQGVRHSFNDPAQREALTDILRVGTSAGGARAKAVIAWNRDTNEVRSGQVPADPGFEHWLLKFDGVAHNRDRELDAPTGFGTIEFAYSTMAKAAGILMTECRLLEENGRRHFMTRRFDRSASGDKLHMQSLSALGHFDFNAAGAYSYEQAFAVMQQLGLPKPALEEQFRRMLFNIVARNQDDHVKNIAFLMDKQGAWTLSPAFDLSYSYNPTGTWTSRHQMTLQGKQDDFTLADIRACARLIGLQRGHAEDILGQVNAAVAQWEHFASVAGVPDDWIQQVQQHLRLTIRP